MDTISDSRVARFSLSDDNHPMNQNGARYFYTYPVYFFQDLPLAESVSPIGHLTKDEIDAFLSDDNFSYGDVSMHVEVPGSNTTNRFSGSKPNPKIKDLVLFRPEGAREGAYIFATDKLGRIPKAAQIFIAERIQPEVVNRHGFKTKIFEILHFDLDHSPFISNNDVLEIMLRRDDLDTAFKEDLLARYLVSIHKRRVTQHTYSNELWQHDIGTHWRRELLDLSGTGIDMSNVFARMMKMKDHIRTYEVLPVAFEQIDLSPQQFNAAFLEASRKVLSGNGDKSLVSTRCTGGIMGDEGPMVEIIPPESVLTELRETLGLMGVNLENSLGLEFPTPSTSG